MLLSLIVEDVWEITCPVIRSFWFDSKEVNWVGEEISIGLELINRKRRTKIPMIVIMKVILRMKFAIKRRIKRFICYF